MMTFVLCIGSVAEAKTKAPKTVVKEYFAACKKMNYKKVNSLTYSDENKVDSKQLKSVPNVYSYIKTNNKKMKVVVKSQKIKGKQATVKIKATYVNSKDVMDDFTMKAYLFYLTNLTASEAELTKGLDDLFQASVDACGERKTVTETVNIKLKKKKNKWLVDDKNAYKIGTAGLYTEIKMQNSNK